MRPIPVSNYAQWKFVIQTNLKLFLSFFAIIMLVAVMIHASGNSQSWFQKTDKFALTMDVTLLATVFLVGFHQYKAQWIKNLDNFATIEYHFNGQLQMKFEYIPMASVHEIRNQAQSMAGALNNGNVELVPALHKIEHGKIITIDHQEFDFSGIPIELHTAIIHLNNPLNEQPLGRENKPGLKNLDINLEREYVLWRHPFKTNHILAVDKQTGQTRFIQSDQPNL